MRKTSLNKHSITLNIQSIVKIKLKVRIWKQRAQTRLTKHQKHRLQVIKEWITTENNYVRDLNIIIHNIKTPMHEKAILTKDQLKIVFANIEAILSLSERLLEQLVMIKNNWEPDTIMISEKLNKFYPYFKIYSEYYNNYHEGWNIIREIKHLEDVQQISKALYMDFQSYLIKPIQRPPKYELLINEYWQHMSKKHPDYEGVRLTIQKYRKVNSENNNKLDQKQKIAEIVRLGRIYSELVKPGRQLIKQFTATTFFISVVKVYLMTDLILITKQENSKESFEKAIELDGTRSFVDYKTSKCCNDLTLIVCGTKEAVHLKFSNKNLMVVAQKSINNVLSYLHQKQKAKLMMNKKFSKKDEIKTTTASYQTKDYIYSPTIRVTSLGVQKKQVSFMKKDSYYFLKLSTQSFPPLHQIICVKFKQIQKLRQRLCLEHPTINFPLISPNLKQFTQISVSDMSFASDHKTNYRLICLPEFLNFLFRCDKVMNNPLVLLSALRVEQSFWQYSNHKQFDHCQCMSCKSSSPVTIRQCMHERFYFIKNNDMLKQKDFCLYKHMKNRRELLQIPKSQFQTLEQKLMYFDYYQGKIDHNMIYKKNTAKQASTVKISLMSLDYPNIQISISQESTVSEVIGQICRSFRIYSYQDFGLFIEGELQMHLLDEDLYILDIMKQNEKNVSTTQKGLMSKIKNIHKWSKSLFKHNYPKIYFGKYLFLEPQLQKAACQRSTIRYWLTIQQIFFYIHKKLIFLGDSELKRITALYLCLRLQDQIKILTRQNFPNDKVANLVGCEMMSTKWILEVLKILDIQKDLVQKHNFLMIINDRVLDIAQNKFGWNSTLFQITKTTHQPNNLVLAISLQGITVKNRNTKQVVLKIPIQSLKFKIVLFNLIIQFDQLQVLFQVKSSYNFLKIAQKYTILHKLFNKNNVSEIVSQY